MFSFIRKSLSEIPRLRPKAAAGLLLFLTIGLVAIYERERLANSNALYQTQLETTKQISELRETIQTEVFDRILELQLLSTVLRTNPNVSEPVLGHIVQYYLDENPDVIRISVAPDLIVDRVYPREGNQHVLGRDYRKDQAALPKLMRALQEDHGIVMGPVPLDQGRRGMVLRQPVLLHGDHLQTHEPMPWGMISMVVDYESFLTRLNLAEISKSYDVMIREIGDDTAAQQIFFGDPELRNRNPETLMFRFPFGLWEIAATPAGGWSENRSGFLTSILIEFAILGALVALIWYVISLTEANRANKQLLTNAIEALPYGFATFDPDGRLQTFNSRFESLYGRDAISVTAGITYESLVWETLQQGVFPEAKGQEKEWFNEWLGQRAMNDYDAQVRSADGRIFRVSDRRMPDQSTVGLRIDITELENAKIEAEAANQAKSDFMAVLSHELRTPLTVMLGMTRLTKNLDRLPEGRDLLAAIGGLSAGDRETIEAQAAIVFERVSQMMGRLENSGEHIMFLVNEILDFAKLQANGLTLTPQEIDIANIVQKVTDQISPIIADKGLKFEVSSLSQMVVVDPVRIHQVLGNLLGNAAKFTSKGSITLQATALPHTLEILVQDTGLGMPQDEVEKIFDPFHQVDPQNKRGFGGTGLGLAISREIMQAHGGTLSATTVEGKGSTFRMTFNLPTGLEPSLDDI